MTNTTVNIQFGLNGNDSVYFVNDFDDLLKQLKECNPTIFTLHTEDNIIVYHDLLGIRFSNEIDLEDTYILVKLPYSGELINEISSFGYDVGYDEFLNKVNITFPKILDLFDKNDTATDVNLIYFILRKIRHNKYCGCHLMNSLYDKIELFITDDLKNDFSFCLNVACDQPPNFKFINDRMEIDRYFVLELVGFGGQYFRNIPKKWHNDMEIALIAIEENANNVDCISAKLCDDREVSLFAVKNRGYSLQYFPRWCNDKDFVLHAVKQNGDALRFASSELKNDEDVVMAAVKQDGFSLLHANKNFRDNKLIALEAVKQNKMVYNELYQLQNDPDIFSEASKVIVLKDDWLA